MAGERPRGFRTTVGRAAGDAFGRVANPNFLAAVAVPAGAAVLTLLFVIPTLAPGVANWDTAEFQTVAPVLGTGHPTGYPSYVILGWLASIVLQPFGEPAYRMNLLQALLAAASVAGTAAIVQILTGRRLIALATGVTLVCTQLFWRLSTHADYHMFHVALVAILFVLLLVWDARNRSEDADKVSHADRWLVGAAFVYGVAVGNHSLALLLAPAVAIFVVVADWRVILRWRTIVACVAVLFGTIVVVFAEMPIRAAMGATLVYGHPDNWDGFWWVVLAKQFQGSLSDPLGNLPTKGAHVVDLFATWLGPIGQLAIIGLGTSLIRRPRYIILSGLAAVATCVFSASYANADIERYYLVPLLIALTWAGLAVADFLGLVGWFVSEIELTRAGPPESAPEQGRRDMAGTAVLIGEIAIAAVLIYSATSVVPTRQLPINSTPGAVSQAGQTDRGTWVRQVLAPADQGGLPRNAVIESLWDVSTTLWYGQKALGLRPDILIVDDSTRKNDHIGPSGEVWDVLDMYLGSRPVFTVRPDGGCDGIQALRGAFHLEPTAFKNPDIYQVVARLAPKVSLPPCDPVR